MVASILALMLNSQSPLAGADEPAAEAKALLGKLGQQRGICLVLGDPQGKLAVELAKASELLVYLQAAKADETAAARKTAAAAGLLGTRVYVEQGDPKRIHLADNLADAIVVAAGDPTPQTELLRVLRPEGKALVGKAELTKPFAKDTDDWSHPYHGPDNNPQSQDKVARGPFLTQFMAEPWYATMPEVTVISGGRIFKAFGNRTSAQPQWPVIDTLICMNAFNGVTLWKRPLSAGFMIHRNTIIATPKTLYLADDVSCKLIDPATGKVVDEIKVPDDISDGPVWKWMALQDGVLYALVGEKEPADQMVKTGGFRGAGWPWWKITPYPFGFGKTILALDPATKKVLWHHREKEAIDTRGMGLAGGKLFFCNDQKFLGALDAKTGKVAWKTSDEAVLKAIGDNKPAQNPGEGFASTSYIKCSDKVLLFAGPTRVNLVGVSATDGKLLWQQAGAGNSQLVLRDDALYALGGGRINAAQSSLKLHPVSGEVLAKFPSRDRCTRATGCVDSIFTRGGKGGSTAVFDVTSREPQVRVLSPMRPACQDGVVVAHGQFYWGPWLCRCDLTQIGSIALTPGGSFRYEGKATDAERLEANPELTKVAMLPVTADDWPTYRKDNVRGTRVERPAPAQVKQLWEFKPSAASAATAPVAAGGLIFSACSDGSVHALDAVTGKPRWSAHTGGQVKYSPTVWNNRLYVGSGDGWIYCYEAATGRQLWRFRGAPVERKIPVFGSLVSTWPIGSGVLVEDGTAYAAAGIFNYNGTHVYALDAVTGKLRWQNNTSGNPTPDSGPIGAGVQGHLLLHNKKLCLAGGTTAPVALYDLADGKYSSKAAGGGKDLYVSGDQVVASGLPLYWRPEDSHFINAVELASSAGNISVTTPPNGQPSTVALLDAKAGADGKPKAIWTAPPLGEVAGIVIMKDAVLIASVERTQTNNETKTASSLTALNLSDGKALWKQPLPAEPVSFGLAVDRENRVLVSFRDGRVLGFGAGK